MSEQRPFGASTAVFDDGEWMLIQRGNEPWKGCWSLPGGRLDDGETPHACAVRELAEETGLAVEPNHVHEVDQLDLGSGRLLAVHVAHLHGVKKSAAPADDAAALQWLMLEEIQAMPLDLKTPHLDMLMEKVAAKLANL